MNIAFIGGGNMATALIRGLQDQPELAGRIHVSDPSAGARARLAAETRARCFESAAQAIEGAEVIVLAVKPQVMPAVLRELRGHTGSGQLVISVAAGTTVEAIRAELGAATAVVRTMPNTPALRGAGITGLFAGPGCDAAQRDAAEAVMRAVGATVWVEEEGQMDVVTAISGSGPAYFYLLAEALAGAGARLGLPREVADRLARHTAHGAGVMARAETAELAELRARVTSPGGTTQAALEVLREGGFERLVDAAAEAATRRGRELAATEPGK